MVNVLHELLRIAIVCGYYDRLRIISIDCQLVSATINKINHYSKHSRSANVRSYTLLACLERFNYFLEDLETDEIENYAPLFGREQATFMSFDSYKGKAYYEEFTNFNRRKIMKDMQWLQNIPNFSPTRLGNIKETVENGKPQKDIVLQFADFFVYTAQIKFATADKKQDRWKKLKHKYYNYSGNWRRRGFVRL